MNKYLIILAICVSIMLSLGFLVIRQENEIRLRNLELLQELNACAKKVDF